MFCAILDNLKLFGIRAAEIMQNYTHVINGRKKSDKHHYIGGLA